MTERIITWSVFAACTAALAVSPVGHWAGFLAIAAKVMEMGE